MFGQKQLALGMSFTQFQVELLQSGLQVLDLGFLMRNFLFIAFGHISIADGAIDCGAGKIVLLLVDGDLRFPHPFGMLVDVFLMLLPEQMFVGDGDGDRVALGALEADAQSGSADGTEREVDCLIVATGFRTTDQPIAHHLKGSDGRSLADAWRESGMVAYKGTTVAGFPNLFQIVGPNTGLGHSSMVFVIESQIAYILGALRAMGELGLASIEPRADAQAVWNEALHKRMARTVWSTGGCSSWYLDEHGRNTVLWPRSTFTLRRQLGSFDPDAYVVTARDAPTSKEDVA